MPDALANPANQKFRPRAAAAVVIANMIGTGVFTSLGFQLVAIHSDFLLLMLWLVGGVAAFCGALTYAELGAALPRSGGEYNFLSRIYHPAAGFVSGWISVTIGFSAPTALAAITFGTYLRAFYPAVDPTLAATLLILVLAGVHGSNRRNSGGLQVGFTTLKIIAIALFCLAAWIAVPHPQPLALLPGPNQVQGLVSGPFAVSLIFVNYAYTGWNAATYLSGELENPQRTLPRVLAIGTGAVLLLYLLLNFTFLYVAPKSAMSGQIEIGFVAAQFAFGATAGRLMGLLLALLLISTVSAMVLAGPRVLQVIGQDFPLFGLLARTNDHGVPTVAIAAQCLLSVLLVATSTFESVLVVSGFVLGLNTLVTIAGVFVLRWREPSLPRPYRTWLYPFTPLLYLAITGWTLVYVLLDRPEQAYIGLALMLAGMLVYLSSRLRRKTQRNQPRF